MKIGPVLSRFARWVRESSNNTSYRMWRKYARWTFALILPSVLTVAIAASISSGWQQQSAPLASLDKETDQRERYQRATDVLKALELSKGDWVADVGAGSGSYVQRMSDMVGPAGKVFGEDIADDAIESLRQRVRTFELRNVEIVKGAVDNPKLPADMLAAVLVVNSYHHFTQYQAMLEQIFRSLKPGGRLVIADYSLPAHRTESRTDQIKSHEIDPELVRAEMGQVGFQIVSCANPFLKRMPEVKKGDRIAFADMWLMVAIRPK